MQINKAAAKLDEGGWWLTIEADLGQFSIHYAMKPRMRLDNVVNLIWMGDAAWSIANVFPGVRGKLTDYLYGEGVTDDPDVWKLASRFYEAVESRTIEAGDFPIE